MQNYRLSRGRVQGPQCLTAGVSGALHRHNRPPRPGATHSILVDSMIQLTSHVAPSSTEKACSQRHVVLVMSDHRKRTRIGRPSKVSGPMKVPTPSLKPPTTGGSRRPGLRPSSHQIDQRSDHGSKVRSEIARYVPFGISRTLSSMLP